MLYNPEIINKNANQADRPCYHCGDDCGKETIQLAGKQFCCQGCKMVFQILNEQELCQYYEIDEKAGISLKGKKIPQYAWLDDLVIQTQLIDFQEDTTIKVRFFLPAIHCASCVWLLENLYKFNDGILNSRINFIKKEVYLTFDNTKITLRQIAELLASIGYIPEINLGDIDPQKKQKIDKKLIYQLGIAGFAFGNIMLLSFPDYLGLSEIDIDGFQKWFGLLSIFLSLPVLLYSGQDYLRSAWLSVSRGRLNIDVPISIGMLTLFGRSLYEIFTHAGPGYLDSLAGLVFFLLIGKWFQQMTFHQLSFERDYKSYFPIAATRKDGNTTPIQNLKPGDTIIVKNEELIPADGILMRGEGQIDYAFVTGESNPVTKVSGDQIFAGGRQLGTALELQITKTVSQSYLTQLWNDVAFTKSNDPASVNYQPNTQNLADKVGRYFTIFILVVAFLTLAWWLPIDSSKAINAFTAVLIIACPCAVALSIPFTFGNALRILGRHGFYLKNVLVIEAFQKITSVVFDKTGTITTSGKEQRAKYIGKPLTVIENAALYQLVTQSNHPLSRQILNSLLTPDQGDGQLINFEETKGQGLRGQYISKTQLFDNQLIEIGSAVFTKNTKREDANVFININGENKGYYSFNNSLRLGFEPLLTFFKKRQKIHLLSGDHDHTRAALGLYFGDNLHYEQSPNDKLQFIKELQKEGEKVLMLGDGLNDAGALQQGNVGVVIAEDTNNFTPACDAILAAQSFEKLPRFVAFMRGCVRLVYVAYGLALIYNIIGLSFAVQAKLSPVIAAILMPASSITIVLFGVISGSWLAWKLDLGDKNHTND